MKRLAALYGGSLPEHRAFDHPNYRRWLAEVIYLLDLPHADLNDFDGLLIPEGTHHVRLQAASEQIQRFLGGGGTVLLFGDQPIRSWLPGLDWEWRPAESSGELVSQHADHSFHRRLGSAVALGHYHGVLHPPAGAETLLATTDGAAVLYIDRVSTPGTLLVASLDAVAHFEALPAAERFLDGFFPWVAEELLQSRPGAAMPKR